MTQTTILPVGRDARGAGKSSLLMRTGYIVGAVAFAAELLMAAVPAALADPSRVHTGDLDLNSDIGIAVLEQRIATAARTACRTADRISDPLIGYRRCIADTSATVRAQLEGAIHRSRGRAVQVSANGQASAAR